MTKLGFTKVIVTFNSGLRKQTRYHGRIDSREMERL